MASGVAYGVGGSANGGDHRGAPGRAVEDCLTCRVLGTASLGGSATYVAYHAAKVPASRPLERLAVGGFAAALAVLSAYRWNLYE